MKIKIDPSESQGKREVVFTGTSLKAYILRRDEKPGDIHSAVYILMDHRRTAFYIGESGDTSGGGFVNRFQSHKSKKNEKWWDIALCFIDSSELFDKAPVRKWIESRLNEIAREEGYLVISFAGASGEPTSDAENKLSEILDFCWLLGVPWARERTSSVTKKASIIKAPVKAKHIVKEKQVLPTKPKSKDKGSWSNKTQLAKLIAEHGGNVGSFGHIWLVLSRKRTCAVGSNWRPILAEIGLQFDAQGYVIDWTKAKNPLPWT